MSKPNRKGRNSNQQFILLHRGVTESRAWKSLRPNARCLLLEIWGRHNGANNGKIPYSFREAKQALGIGTQKCQEAFAEIIDRGFVICTTEASFNWKVGAGKGAAREWELTTEPCNGEVPKASFRKWRDNDFTVPTGGTDGSHGKNSSVP